MTEPMTPEEMYWHDMSFAGCGCGWRGPYRRFIAETEADLKTHQAEHEMRKPDGGGTCHRTTPSGRPVRVTQSPNEREERC